MYKSLSTEFPKVPDHRRNLAISNFNLGNIRQKMGRTEEAESAHRRALELRRLLAAEFPKVPVYRRYLGDSLGQLGNLLRGIGKLSEAESVYRQGLEVSRGLAERVLRSP